MQVYYESLCPDSILWVNTQLFPTYQILGQYMTVDFNPFGKASVNFALPNAHKARSIQVDKSSLGDGVNIFGAIAGGIEFTLCFFSFLAFFKSDRHGRGRGVKLWSSWG